MGKKLFKSQNKINGRLLLLEDDVVTGEWLGAALAKSNIEVHWFDKLDEALLQVQTEPSEPFHGIVTDIFMQDGESGGLKLVEAANRAGIPTAIITSGANLEIAKSAINLGACCFLEKPIEVEALIKHMTNVWQEPKFLSALLERNMETQQLTSKEREVCRLVFKGLSNKEIAGVLGVTEKTVKFHVTSIFEKFGVKSRSELASSIFPT